MASLSSLMPAQADDWRAGRFRTLLLEEPLLTLLLGLGSVVFLEEPPERHKSASEPGLSLLLFPLRGGTFSQADEELCCNLLLGALVLSGTHSQATELELSPADLRLPRWDPWPAAVAWEPESLGGWEGGGRGGGPLREGAPPPRSRGPRDREAAWLRSRLVLLFLEGPKAGVSISSSES